MQEHVVQQVSHGSTAHATLEAARMAVDVQVLDGDLCVTSYQLSAVCAVPEIGRGAAVGVGGSA